MQEWANIISSLGFPIASCFFLAWYMSTSMKEFRNTIEENSKLISELIILVRERGSDYVRPKDHDGD